MMVLLVARFRQRINSVKHVIDAEGTLTGGVSATVPLGVAVPVRSDPFNPQDIVLGETINAMFISVFMIGTSGGGNQASINWFIWKQRTGQIGSNLPEPGDTGISNVRNQIFHEEKGLAGSQDGTPMAFKGVIIIPKGFRRTREGDAFQIRLKSASQGANDTSFCVKAIYKSFS